MMEAQDSAGWAGAMSGQMLDRPVVALRFGGHRVGLYRVKQVGEVGMLLNHGGISFPVGTQLDVEDVGHLIEPSRNLSLSAVVVGNTSNGLRLVWRRDTAGRK